MTTRDLVLIALFAALTAALALFPPIALPLTGVPITAQSMGPMLAGAILGMRRGGLSQVLFLLLVMVGLPLLSGGRGGFGVFPGVTGGFLISWPIAAVVIGLLWRRLGSGIVGQVLAVAVGGIGVVYLIGTPWMAVVLGWSIDAGFAAMLPFLPGDIIKALLTVAIARGVARAYPLR
ncbi:MAG: biotin transporter BioY [Alphaproteobacteria bacterium]|nr:biotin transporter BioY [Alphaproteobacteria bacterium]